VSSTDEPVSPMAEPPQDAPAGIASAPAWPAPAPPPAAPTQPVTPAVAPAAPSSSDPPSAAHQPLILGQVSMRGASRIALVPHRALLFSDRSGTIVRLNSYPNLIEARRYDMRYEVDLSLRHARWVCEVPSRTSTASFVVTMEVGWRVTDPTAVVQFGIIDGLEIIRPRLEETARTIGHSYPIHESIDFERHLNRVLGNGAAYAEGVGVLHCTVQIRQDERHRRQESAIVDEEYKNKLREIQGKWVAHIDSELDLLKEYLKDNRAEIPAVLAEMRKRAEAGNTRDTQRYQDLLKSDLVSSMDDLEEGLKIIGSDASGVQAGPIPLVQPRAEVSAAPDRVDEEIQEAEVVDEDIDPRTLRKKEGGVDGWVSAPWRKDAD
jgi:hypothetical protein